jgi:hypothetical protein
VWRFATWQGVQKAVEWAVNLALGVALVWYEAAIAGQFNFAVFAGGLTLLGVPVAYRWDKSRRDLDVRRPP